VRGHAFALSSIIARASTHSQDLMTTPDTPSHNITDTVLTGGLVTSPAWASWLGDFNQLLTTATLVIGLAIGLGRLWQLLLGKRKANNE
jgi:hypothetical protein